MTSYSGVSVSLRDSTRLPVTIEDTSPNDTLDPLEDPFENDDVENKMDHEVERVLREWDTNKQRITHNSIRLRPTPAPSTPAPTTPLSTTPLPHTPAIASNLMSTSMPCSPSQQRRKRYSNSMSNVSAKGTASPAATSVDRKHFDFPEINISRREDARMQSGSFEALSEDSRQPLYISCPKSGQRLFKMEFDTEGYPHENISIRVSGDKLVIHATQNETVEGRVSTTEFCRKVKLPRDVNSKRLDCHVNPSNGMLVITAPTHRSPASSTASSLSPHSPGVHHRAPSVIAAAEPLNVPQIRNSSVGRTLYLNAEVGSVFQSDDVTVKVIGQTKLLILASRQENKDGNTLTASLTREFALEDKIIPKTIQAGLSNDGVLKIAALLDTDNSACAGDQGRVHIELENINGCDAGSSGSGAVVAPLANGEKNGNAV